LWNKLGASSLSQAVKDDRATTKNDEQQALCAALEMQHFAEAASVGDLLRLRAFELSAALGQPATEVEGNLARLVQMHATEWRDFLAHLGPRSFIKSWLEARP
jgi:hypothetical protein